MLSTLLRFVLAILFASSTMAAIPSDTSVGLMLGMIPKCAVPCVLDDVFTAGGCPPTTAGALSACACTNVTLQAHLSACVQQSCSFLDQQEVSAFASGLCEAYPKQSRVHELRTIAVVTIVLSVPILFLRLYSRWLKSGRLFIDDAYAVVAAILLIGVSAIILRMSLGGFGLHYWDVPAANGVDLLRMFYVCQMLYIGVQVFSKVAILALYSRLFPNFIVWFRWAIRAMTAFMFIHGLVFFLLVTFQCLPISAIWDKTINGKCLPITTVIGFTGAGLSIAEDFIILILPLSELWKLQMNTKKKVSLTLLLCVGSFASITSIIRLKYVLKYANTYDSTWDNVDVIKWSLIEILSACLCGNLIPLRQLLEKITPSVRTIFTWYSDWSRKSSQKHSGHSSWTDGPKKTSKKPKLLSTLNFTQMSLTSGWDWKKTGESEMTVAPASPLPVHLEKEVDESAGHAGDDDVEKLPCGVIRKTSTTILSSTQTTFTDSERKPSRDESERGLVRGGEQQQQRKSKRWSRAFHILPSWS